MKKLTIFVIIFLAINTHICLAGPPLDEQQSKLSDLSKISNDIQLDLNMLLKNDYNKEKMTKDLNYTKSAIKGVITRSNTIKDNNKEQRFEDAVVLIASLYNIAINGMFYYMEDPEMNLNFLLDSSAQARIANMLLNELTRFISK